MIHNEYRNEGRDILLTLYINTNKVLTKIKNPWHYTENMQIIGLHVPDRLEVEVSYTMDSDAIIIAITRLIQVLKHECTSITYTAHLNCAD